MVGDGQGQASSIASITFILHEHVWKEGRKGARGEDEREEAVANFMHMPAHLILLHMLLLYIFLLYLCRRCGDSGMEWEGEGGDDDLLLSVCLLPSSACLPACMPSSLTLYVYAYLYKTLIINATSLLKEKEREKNGKRTDLLPRLEQTRWQWRGVAGVGWAEQAWRGISDRQLAWTGTGFGGMAVAWPGLGVAHSHQTDSPSPIPSLVINLNPMNERHA